ncbi:MAG: hypothetical protein L0H94_01190 [Nitrospira sp.]|nr:hypothetical protein [Nitrospira sp.]
MSLLTALMMTVLLCLAAPAHAEEPPLVALLRAQALNKIFDGFEYYHVTIESDLAQADGTHEVMAVASGKFLDQTKRIKVLVLVVGDTVVGGQVLDEKGLPPCVMSFRPSEGSL